MQNIDFDKITVGEFLEIAEISDSDKTDIEKTYQIMSIMTGESEEEIVNSPDDSVQTTLTNLKAFLKQPYIDKKPRTVLLSSSGHYLVEYNIQSYSENDLTELVDILENGWSRNLLKLLSIITNALFVEGDKEKDLKTICFNDAVYACLYVLNRLTDFTKEDYDSK